MSETPIAVADRRNLTRSPLRASAKVECHRSGAGSGPNLAVDALNISETGIRLQLREALATGDEICMKLHADGLREPAVRQGKVVWCLELPADGHYYAGVCFDRPLLAEQLGRLAAPVE